MNAGATVLKDVEDALPTHRSWMDQHVGVGKETVDNVAWLPSFRVRIQRHVDHHRSADEVLPGNATPEAAVVRICSIVAHREITIVGNAIREYDIDSTALRVSRRCGFCRT